ncbi:hypothetical protein WMY93_009655 [Mugilogobius chulae]|uniref:Cadherin domain-containing protein n=1 Tax=Mugilogobius chulae TaxID=88201 RepID=A0AAW0PL76_9GOBI
MAASAVQEQWLKSWIICLTMLTFRGISAQVRYSINEEIKKGTELGNVAKDLGLDLGRLVERNLRVVSGTKPDLFKINPEDGRLSVNNRVDREDLCAKNVPCMINLKAIVENPLEMHQLVVEIQDINDNAPRFPDEKYTVEILESAIVGSRFQIEGAQDLDVGLNSLHSYKMAHSPYFRLETEEFGEDGKVPFLILQKPLDREDKAQHILQITASDGGKPPKSSAINITILVSDVNDNPPICSKQKYTVTIKENAPMGTFLLTINATDADSGVNGEIEYSIRSKFRGLSSEPFDLDSKTGRLSVKGELDFEEKQLYELKVVAADKGAVPLSTHCNVIVTVEDVNDNPPEIDMTSLSGRIAEDAPLGTVVALMAVTDRDSGLNGEFQVVASDSGTPSLSSNVTVHVFILDQNDNAPVILYPVSSNGSAEGVEELPRNVNAGHLVTKVRAYDADIGYNGWLLFSLLEVTDHSLFGLDRYTGQIRTLRSFTETDEAEHKLVILVKDNGNVSLSATATVLVKVVEPREAFAASDVKSSAKDAEDTNVTFYLMITLASVSALFIISIIVLIAMQCSKSSTDYTSKYLQDTNYDGTLCHSIQYRSGDKRYMLVGPRMSVGSTIVPGSQANTLVLPDRRRPSEEIRYSVPEEVKDGTVVGNVAKDLGLDVASLGERRFRVVSETNEAVFGVNSDNGALYVHGRIDREQLCQGSGTCLMELKVLVENPLEVHYVVVEITDVNDHAPTFPKTNETIEIAEHTLSGNRFQLHPAVDPDAGANSIRSYTLSANEYFDINVRESDLRKTPFLVLKKALDREEKQKLSLLVTAVDGGKPRRSRTLNVTVIVLDSNDNRPVFTQEVYEISVKENVEIGKVVISVTATDADDGTNGEIEYSLRESIIQEDFLDREEVSNYDITIKATDCGEPPLSTTKTLSIQILDVNDNSPQFEQNPLYFYIVENNVAGTSLFSVTAADKDKSENADVSYSIARTGQEKDVALFLNVNTENGQITALKSFDFEALKSFQFQVVASDSGTPSLSSNVTVHVFILDQNDNAPVILYPVSSNGSAEGVEELPRNVNAGHLVTKVRAYDADIGYNGWLLFSLQEVTDHSLFGLDRYTGQIRTLRSFTETDEAEHKLVILVKDNGNVSLSATATVLVKVVEPREAFAASDVKSSAKDAEDTNVTFYLMITLASVSALFIISIIVLIAMQCSKSSTDYTSKYLQDTNYDGTLCHSIQYRSGDKRYMLVGPRMSVGSTIVPGSQANTLVLPDRRRPSEEDFLDREEVSNYDITIKATDCGEPPLSTTKTLSIQILDVNDNSPQFEQNPLYFYIVENNVAGTSLFSVTAADKDKSENADVSYSIARTGQEKDVALFLNVNAENGQITALKSFDFEALKSFQFQVVASDSGTPSLSSNVTVHVFILDQNDNAPVILYPVSSNGSAEGVEELPRNVNAGHLVTKVRAYDADIGYNGWLLFSLQEVTDHSLFGLDRYTGQIRTLRSFTETDEAEHKLVILVKDNGNVSLSATATVLVKVVEPREAFAASDVKSSAKDAEDTNVTFYLMITLASVSALFIISIIVLIAMQCSKSSTDYTSKYLQDTNYDGLCATASSTDLETSATYSGTPSLSSNVTVHVFILDQNDNAPVILYPVSSNGSAEGVEELPRNVNAGHLVTKVRAYDADIGYNGWLLFSLQEVTDHSLFGLDRYTGQIRTLRSFTETDEAEHKLVILVKDNGNVSLSATATVLVKVVEPREAFAASDVKSSAKDAEDTNVTFYLMITLASVSALFIISIIVLIAMQCSKSSTDYTSKYLQDTNYDGTLCHSIQYRSGDKRYMLVGPRMSVGSTIVPGSQANTLVLPDRRRPSEESFQFQVVASDSGTPSLSSNVTVHVFILDQNDNAPVILYPVSSNGSAEGVEELPRNVNAGHLVTKVRAYDADIGYNGWLLFSLQEVTDHSLFGLDRYTGQIRTLRSFTETDEAEHKLVILVKDNGNVSLSATATVLVKVVEPREAFAASDVKSSAKDAEDTNVTFYLMITLASVSALFIISIIVLIAMQCSKSSTDYTSKYLQDTNYDGTLCHSIQYRSGDKRYMLVGPRMSVGSTIVTGSQANTLVLPDRRRPSEEIRYSVPEEVKDGTVVGNVAKDLGLDVASLGERRFRVVSETNEAVFGVNSDNGALYVHGRIDREQLCQGSGTCLMELKVLVENPLEVHYVVVEITDVNDHAPTFPQTNETIEIWEQTLTGKRFQLPPAVDPDAGINSIRTYTLSANEHFDINVRESDLGKTPFLILKKALDREEKQKLSLLVTAVDGGKPRRSGTLNVTVIVLDSNDNKPVFTQEVYEISVKENVEIGTVVIGLTATDADDGTNGEIEYSLRESLIRGVKNIFTLNKITGEIATKEQLNFEEFDRYELDIEASDKATPPLTGECRVIVKIIDVNDNSPEIDVTSLSNTVSEDSKPGTVVSLIRVKDADSGVNGKIMAHITNNVPFELKPSYKENTYSVVTKDFLDREEVSNYDITIKATDCGEPPLSTTKTLSIQILDVNDNSPQFEQNPLYFYIVENNVAGTSLFSVTAADKDKSENAEVSYSIARTGQEKDVALFLNVNVENGKITALKSFDFEILKSFQFQVVASDSGTPSLSSNVTVHVFILDQNDNAPVILYPVSSNGSAEGVEELPRNVNAGHLVTKVRAYDADIGYNGWLLFSLQEVTDHSLFGLDRYTGQIRTLRSFTETDEAEHKLVILVKDNGNVSLSATATVLVKVVEPERLLQLLIIIVLIAMQCSKSSTDYTSKYLQDTNYDGTLCHSIQYRSGDKRYMLVGPRMSVGSTIVPGSQANTLVLPDRRRPRRDVNDNSPEFVLKPYSFYITEGNEAGAQLFSVQAVDKDEGENAHVSYHIYRDGSDENKVTSFLNINGENGQITALKSFNFEALKSFQFQVVASDSGTPSLSSNVTVHVFILDQNDNAPVILYPVSSNGSAEGVEELPRNVNAGHLVTKVRAYDADIGYNGWLLFSLQEVTDHSLFGLDRYTGQIRTLRSFTETDEAEHKLVILVKDNGNVSLSATATVLVKVVEPREAFAASDVKSSAKDSEDTNVTFYLMITLASVSALFIISIIVLIAMQCSKSSTDYTSKYLQDTNYDGTLCHSIQYRSGDKRYMLVGPRMSVGSTIVPGSQANTLVLPDRRRPSEEVKDGTVVGNVAKDLGLDVASLGERRFRVVSETNEAVFGVNSDNGALYVHGRIDREQLCQGSGTCLMELKVLVENPLEVHYVVVEITDVNDHAPTFPKTNQTFEIGEHTLPGKRFQLHPAHDPDAGINSIRSYTLSANEHFEINIRQSDLGKIPFLELKKPLDREQSSRHYLRLTAVDGGKPQKSGTLNITIVVLDSNDNKPVFSQEVYHIIASDKATPPLTGECRVIIKIIDVNDNSPEIDVTSLSNTVSEDSKPGTVVSLIRVKDKDSGVNGKIMAHITNNVPFELKPSYKENTYSVVTKDFLDREEVSNYDITIKATDCGEPPLSTTKTLSIQILDVNDNSPQFEQNPLYFYIVENNVAGTSLFSVTAADKDKSENADVSYSIARTGQEKDVALFLNVNAENGQITALKSFDFEALKSFQFQVVASDSGTPSLSSNVTVHVFILDQNDNAPVILYPVSSNGSAEGVEELPRNVNAGHLVTKVRAYDADIGYNGWLLFSLQEVTDHSLFGLDRYTGQIRTLRSFTETDEAEHKLVILVKDNGNVSLSATANVLVKVVEPREAFAASDVKSSAKDAEDTNVTFYLMITLASVSALFIISIIVLIAMQCSKSSTDYTSKYLQDTNYDGTLCHSIQYRSGDKRYMLVGPRMSVGSTIVPGSQANTLVLPDRRRPSEEIRYSVPEEVKDGTVVGNVAKDLGLDVASLGERRFRVVSETNEAVFGVNSDNGALYVHGRIDREQLCQGSGTCLMELKVLVENPLEVHYVVVEITDVNDHAPTFPQTNETIEIWEQTLTGKRFQLPPAVDPDAGINSIRTYTLSANEHFDINVRESDLGKTPFLILKKALDREEKQKLSLLVTAVDGGKPRRSGTLNVTVIVLDSNDNKPVFTQEVYEISVKENVEIGTVVIGLTATDADDGTNGEIENNVAGTSLFSVTAADKDKSENAEVSYSIARTGQEKDVALFLNVNAENGKITALKSFDFEILKSFQFQVVASDSGTPSLSSNVTVHVFILDQNDNAPVILYPVSSNGSAEGVEELPRNVNAGHLVTKVRAYDADIGYNGWLLFSLQEVTDHSLFGLDRYTGQIRTLRSFTETDEAEHKLVILVKDNGNVSLSATATVLVKVVEAREAFAASDVKSSAKDAEDTNCSKSSTDYTSKYLQDTNYDGTLCHSIQYRSGDKRYMLVGPRMSVGSTIVPGSQANTLVLPDRRRPSEELLRNGAFAQIRYAIMEEVKEGTIVGNVAKDLGLDKGTLKERKYRIVTEIKDTLFHVNPDDGNLYVSRKIDREEVCDGSNACVLNLKTVLENPLEIHYISVEILDVNDNYPNFQGEEKTIDISESVTSGKSFQLQPAKDPDSGVFSVQQYKLNANDHFRLEVKDKGKEGKIPILILQKQLDRETVHRHSLTLTALDGGKPPKSGQINIIINVLDVNDNAPTFIKDSYSGELTENALIGTTVMQINATDLDEGPNGDVVYRFSDSVMQEVFETFEIITLTGEIIVKGEIDFEQNGEYEIEIEASDKGLPPLTTEKNVIIKILDVNDNAPEIEVTSFSSSIPEDSRPGTTVALISVNDRDSRLNGKVTCSIEGDVPFTLSPSLQDKMFSLVTKSALDRETQSQYVLSIVAKDQGQPSLTSEKNIFIVISDVNDNSPEFVLKPYSFYITEGNEAGAQLFSVQAVDQDEGENAHVSYHIYRDGNEENKVTSFLNLNSENGQITALKSFDFETLKSFQFQVVASDSGTPSLSSNVTVHVFILDQNDNAPVILYPVSSNGSAEGVEELPRNVNAGHLVTKVRAYDADIGYNGWLLFSLQEVTDHSLFGLDRYTGQIRTLRSFTETDEAEHKLVILVKDNGNVSLSATATVLVKVVEPREAFAASDVKSSAKDAEDTNVTFYLMITLASVSALFIISIIVLIAMQCSKSSTDYTSKYLQDTNYDGTLCHSIQYRSGDKRYMLVGPRMSVGSTIVQRARPTHWCCQTGGGLLRRSGGAPRNVNAGHLVTKVRAYDADIGYNGWLLFSLLEVTDHSLFGLDRYTGQIRTLRSFTETDEAEHKLVILVKDNGNVSLSATATVLVKEVTDHSLFGLDRYTGQIRTLRSFTETDEAEHKLVILVKDNGNVIIVLIAMQCSKSSTDYTSKYLQDTNYDGTLCHSIQYRSGDKRYMLVGPRMSVGSTIVPGSQANTLVLPDRRRPSKREEVSNYDITIKATDCGEPPLSTTKTLSIQILDVNDNSPQFEQNPLYFYIVENNVAGTSLFSVTAADKDKSENADVSYSIARTGREKDVALFLNVNAENGQITALKSFDFEALKSFQFQVVASDSGTPSLSSNVTVHVFILDQNDNAPVILYPVSSNGSAEGVEELPRNVNAGHLVTKVRAYDADIGYNGWLLFSLQEVTDHSLFGIIVLIAMQCSKSSTDYTSKYLQDTNYDGTLCHSIQYRSGDKRYMLVGPRMSVGSTIVPGSQANTLVLPDRRRPSEEIRYSVPEEVKDGTVVGNVAKDLGLDVASLENNVAGTSLFSVTAADKDKSENADVSYSIARTGQEKDVALFLNVNVENGQITALKSFDFEALKSFQFQVVASDSGTPSLSSNVTVHVFILDQNDNAPVILYPVSSNGSAEGVEELPRNVNAGHLVTKVRAYDADIGYNGWLLFSLQEVTDHSLFGLDRYTGQIRTLRSFTETDEAEHKLVILVKDNGNVSLSATATVLVKVVEPREAFAASDVKSSAKDSEDSNVTFYLMITLASVSALFIISIIVLIAMQCSKSSTDYTSKYLQDTNYDGTLCHSIQYRSGDKRYMLVGPRMSVGSTIVPGSQANTLVLPDRRRPSEEFQVVASDSGTPSLSSNVTVHVFILDQNDNAPVILYPVSSNGSAEGVEELPRNVNPGHLVTKVRAYDADIGYNGWLLFSLQEVTDHSLFGLDRYTGQIRTLRSFTETDEAEHKLVILVKDNGNVSLSATATVLVKVVEPREAFAASDVKSSAKDAEDTNVTFYLMITLASVSALFIISIIVLIAMQCSKSSTDYTSKYLQDTNYDGTLCHSIQYRSGDKRYMLVGPRMSVGSTIVPGSQANTLVLPDRRRPSEEDFLDREEVSNYGITIKATDCGEPPLSTTKTLSIQILDVNDNSPQFEQNPLYFYIVENNVAGTSLFSVTAADKDKSENADVSYSIARTGQEKDAALFINVNAGNGQITSLKSFDFEALKSFQFQVVASDSGTPSLSSNVTVHVFILDQNDNAPVILYPVSSNGSAEGVEELPRNVNAGHLVTKVRAYDADIGYNGWLLFSLQEVTDHSLFGLDRYTGQIRTLRSFTETDEAEHKLVILVKDNGNVSLSATATVLVKVVEPREAFAASDVKSSAKDSEDTNVTFYLMITLASVSALFIISIIVLIVMQCSKSSTDYTSKHLQDTNYDGTLCHSIQYRSGDKRYMLVGPRMSVGSTIVPGSQANTLVLPDRRRPSEELRYSVTEEVKEGTIVGNVAKDLGLDKSALKDRKYRIVSGAAETLFHVDQKDGNLYVSRKIDREEVCEKSTTCLINLKTVLENPLEVHYVGVEVQDINDNAPAFSEIETTLEISESALPGFRIPLKAARDLDSVQLSIQQYKLSVNEYFRLDVTDMDEDGKIPTLIVQKPLDRETEQRHSLVLTAVDGGKPPKSGQTRIIVNVLDVNDNAPRFTNGDLSVTLAENVPIGTTVIQVNATDLDEGTNGQVVYSFSNSVKQRLLDLFDINSQTGEILIKGLINHEEKEKYVIEVEASDKGVPPLASQKKITIKILDVNDNAPEIEVTSFSSSIPEDSRPGTTVALISVNDRDSGLNGKVTCSIEGDVPFTLSPSLQDKMFSLVTKSALDRETQSQYVLSIVAKDQGQPSLTSEKNIFIVISDVNDNCPEFVLKPYSFYITEGNKAGAQLFSVQAVDQDEGENAHVSYRIYRNGNEDNKVTSFLNINGENGQITALKSFDFETLKSFQFQVVALDSGTPSLSSNVTVHVFILDQNDNAPVILYPVSSNGSAEGVEELPRNVNAGHLVTKVRAYDADIGYNGWLLFSLQEVTDHSLFGLDRYTGQIRTLRSFTETDEAEHKLVILVKDNGNVSLSATATVLVKVVEPREAFAASDVKSSAKDAEDTNVTFYLMITLASVSALFIISIIVLIAMQCSKSSTDYTSKYLQDTNYDGTLCHSIQYRSGDKRYMLVGPRMSVGSTIVPGSQANTLVLPDRRRPSEEIRYSVPEEVKDGTVVGNVAKDLGLDVASLGERRFRVVSETNEAVFGINSDNGALYVHGRIDRELLCQGSGTCLMELKVLVENPLEVHYVVVEITDATGEIITKGPIDFEETDQYELDVEALDKATPPLTVSEDSKPGTVVSLIRVKDKDSGVNGKIMAHITNNVPFELKPSYKENTYSVVTKDFLDREEVSNYDITIKATDCGEPPLSTTKTLSIQILDVNDNSPQFEQNPLYFYIVENNVAGTSLFSVTAADKDKNENADVSYSIARTEQEKDVALFLNVNAENGQITALKSFDFEALKSFQFQVVASDSGTPSLSSNVTVHVFILDQNDNAPVILYPEVTDHSLFGLDRYTGQIRTLRSFTETDEAEHKLVILVKDNGNVSLSATATVLVKVVEPREAFAASDVKSSAKDAEDTNVTFYLMITLASVSALFIISIIVLIAMQCSKSSTDYTSKYLQDTNYDGTLCHSIQYRSGDKRYMLVGPRMSVGSTIVPGSQANTLVLPDRRRPSEEEVTDHMSSLDMDQKLHRNSIKAHILDSPEDRRRPRARNSYISDQQQVQRGRSQI